VYIRSASLRSCLSRLTRLLHRTFSPSQSFSSSVSHQADRPPLSVALRSSSPTDDAWQRDGRSKVRSIIWLMGSVE
jgi:hypothetical protein